MRWAEWPVLAACAAMCAAPSAANSQNGPYAGPAGPVELSQPWATPAPLGNLLNAACATAESAELIGPSQPGAAPTRLDQIGLAPGQIVNLAPDGIHIVLHHLNQPARLGQTLHCTATFAKSGERLFEADIRQAAPPPAPPI
jgi:hypothetical protein